MKQLIFILAVLVTSSIQLTANDIIDAPSISIYSTEKSIILDKTGLLADASSFTITDEEGEIVFTHDMQSDNQKIKYNLRNLPNGIYQININGTNLTEIHEAVITTNNIDLTKIKTFYSPVLTYKNDKVMLNLLSTQPEWISCNIYDSKNKLVYDYSELNEGTLNKVFNLDNLEAGDYTVYVSTNHFTQNLRVNL